MSDRLEAAVAAIKDKMGGAAFDGSVRFDIGDEGSVRIEGETVEISEAEADCVLRADADTFQGILSGDVNPTMAFMTGRLKVDGDMGKAMALSAVLS